MTTVARIEPPEVSEIGAYLGAARLHELADRCLEGTHAELLVAPERGLVMLRVEDGAEGEPFNLVEVLVTRCQLVVDGERGWATVLGHEPERAVATAVLDAATRRRFPSGLERELAAELAAIRNARAARWARIQPTRVELEESA